jgi:o-succinylbenzoate synthase
LTASFIHLYRYHIPFNEPVTVKKHRLLEREGIIIAMKSSDGTRTSYGEIAPLPGLHEETLHMAEHQLMELINNHKLSSIGSIPEGLFPSVKTGIEIALFNFMAISSGLAPVFSSDSQPANRVPLNAMLAGEPDVILKRAETLFNLGYRTFKIKVTPKNAEQTLALIRQLSLKYGETIALRLDANQSFSFDEAVEFSNNIVSDTISYIEEPLSNPKLIGEFHARTAVRSALDETLWQQPDLMLSLPPGALKALVLKPNRLGGIAETLRLAAYARENNLLAVLSSAFESGISLSFYSWLAAHTSMEPAASGLDTGRYLEYDLLNLPFGNSTGTLTPEELYWNGHKVATMHLKPSSIWTL